MQRLTVDEYDWGTVRKNQEFLSRLFTGAGPDRPGAIVHPDVPPGAAPPVPLGLTPHQGLVWNAVAGFRPRSLGHDDFVPALSTNAGTCAMATAFGCEETCTANVFWVKPCITHPDQIDRLRKPALTDGKLGTSAGSDPGLCGVRR